jgi:hypothetical protein
MYWDKRNVHWKMRVSSILDKKNLNPIRSSVLVRREYQRLRLPFLYLCLAQVHAYS